MSTFFLEGCSISYFGRASTNVLDHLRPTPLSLCPYMFIIRIADGGFLPLIGDMSLKKSITFFLILPFPGHPQPQYRWLKDGNYLADFSSEHFYKIQVRNSPTKTSEPKII